MESSFNNPIVIESTLRRKHSELAILLWGRDKFEAQIGQHFEGAELRTVMNLMSPLRHPQHHRSQEPVH
eukprot:SAG31_NODE_60_length_29419_cov_39.876398_21_plen_69_part_00